MGKRRRSSKGADREGSGAQRGSGGASAKPAAGGSGGKGRRPVKGRWMRTHGRDLKFLAVFAALMGLYYLATTTSLMQDRFFPWYLNLNARASAGFVHVFGYDDMRLQGNSLVSPRGSITVERGCDAVEPSALFASAVLASPVLLSSRLLAVLVGTTILMLLNLLRIISLFLTAVHWRTAFDVMHLDVWQAAFIVLSIVLWALWAAWETKRRRPRRTHVGT